MARSSDVIIIGAGIIGCATAYYATQAGLTVTVIDRDHPASGTTSRCEGNLLISDRERGPELELMKLSLSLWTGELAEFGHMWELERKGGIIAASRESSLASLKRVVTSQRQHGIDSQPLDLADLIELEPNITPEALGGAFYPEDSQVQPMLAASYLLRLARDRGAELVTDAPVVGFIRNGEAVTGVRTPKGDFYSGQIINAAGTWAGGIARLAEVRIDILPRRGYVLVTEPLPPVVHHKVYAAEYIDTVGSSNAALQTSPVVEATKAGTVLIGSSRERVGFDSSLNPQALRDISRNGAALFPFLSKVRVLRHYHGFRPYCPDHLPVIGPDPRCPGLWHASGHEGAGIGLAAGTGKVLAQALIGEASQVSLEPFRPERFESLPVESAVAQEEQS